MNGNTADLYWMPLNGGGGTVCPDSICALRNACANGVSAFAQSRAEQSRAEQSRAEQSRAEQSRASNPLLRKTFPASCAELVSYLDPARNQFPYASCADISGSGRRSFGVCRFAGGASRLGKLAQASTDVGITARRGGQCFQAGEREAREAEGMFPLPLRWGLAFASRGKLALLDRKGNAGRERRQEGFHFSYPEGRGIFPILNSQQHNIHLNTKGRQLWHIM